MACRAVRRQQLARATHRVLGASERQRVGAEEHGVDADPALQPGQPRLGQRGFDHRARGVGPAFQFERGHPRHHAHVAQRERPLGALDALHFVEHAARLADLADGGRRGVAERDVEPDRIVQSAQQIDGVDRHGARRGVGRAPHEEHAALQPVARRRSARHAVRRARLLQHRLQRGEDAPCLLAQPEHVKQLAAGADQRHRQHRIVLRGPLQRGAQVVDFAAVARAPALQRDAPGRVARMLEQRQHGARMAPLHVVALAGLIELEQRVLARAFQQAVARAVAAIRRHQRALDQRPDLVDHGPLVLPRFAQHGGGQLEREAADEHAEPPEHRLLGRGQQAVAPVERRHQRLLARRQAAVFAAQQLEALRQPGLQPVQPQQRQARRRQLDGQRDAVQMPAQLDHRVAVVVAQGEAARYRLRLVDEQRHRAVAQRLARGRAGFRHRQRLEPEHALAVDVQRRLAGDEQPHARRAGQQRAGQRRHAVDHLVGVVEHQQGARRVQCLDQRRQRVVLRAQRDLQRLRRGARHLARVGHRRQVDPHHRQPAAGAHRFGRGPGQRGLADAARPKHGDQPMLRQRGSQCGQVVVAAEHGRLRCVARVSRRRR